MLISLPLAVLAVAGLVVINETSFRQSTEAVVQVEQAQLMRGRLDQLRHTIVDAETGQRGYLLTGDERYLEPYNNAITQVNQQIVTLRKMFTSQAKQLEDLDVLSTHIARKLEEMNLSVRMRRENKEEAWRFVLTTDVGNEQMQAIRELASRLVDASTLKIVESQSQIRQTLLLSRIGISVLALVGLMAFYLFLVQNRKLLNAGIREQLSLKRERDQLDLQVRERTATLAELATHLQNVREDERGHLARELHDELGALLTAAKLDVARLKSRLSTAQPEAIERLAHLTATLNSGIALKRRIVEDLRPSSLSHLGLVASLEILAREFEQRADLSIATELEHVDLGGSAQLTVYRLVQESLTNIGKYAEATKITIHLKNEDGNVTVEVADNGKGFDAKNVNPSSHGLTGMRHRVEAAGGYLTVTTGPNQGTKIAAALPKDR